MSVTDMPEWPTPRKPGGRDEPGDPPPLPAWRTRVRDIVGDVPAQAVNDAVLVVNELVVNAYQHVHGPRDVRWYLTAGGACLWAEVDDGSLSPPRFTPQPGQYGGGYGMYLTEALTAAWGVRLHASGKTVWAEVGLTP
jgi:anti-sigma regulatory factor (Ser/Thr protein kinase)